MLHELHIEFQVVGPHFHELDQPGLAGAEVVVRQSDLHFRQGGTQLVHFAAARDGRFVDLQHERTSRLQLAQLAK